MTRKRVSPTKDKRIFRKTANRTHKMNVPKQRMRGGIRL